MEIEALKVRIGVQELNQLLQEALPKDQPVENLAIDLASEGLILRGEYPLFVTVPFESLWQLGVHGGKVEAKLARFQAKGMPLMGVQSLILKFVASSAKDIPGIDIAGDTITVDVDAMAAQHGYHVRTNLQAVRIEGSDLILEAGR